MIIIVIVVFAQIFTQKILALFQFVHLLPWFLLSFFFLPRVFVFVLPPFFFFPWFSVPFFQAYQNSPWSGIQFGFFLTLHSWDHLLKSGTLCLLLSYPVHTGWWWRWFFRQGQHHWCWQRFLHKLRQYRQFNLLMQLAGSCTNSWFRGHRCIFYWNDRWFIGWFTHLKSITETVVSE